MSSLNSLRCGDCGRDDFEDLDELLDHDCENQSDDDPHGGGVPALVADGGTQTRDCPECGLISKRTDLIITQDGHSVCPGCGEIFGTYDALRKGVDHVLITKNRRSGHATFHNPSKHDLVPACDRQHRQHDDDYKPVIPERLPDQYRLCKHCNPNYKITRGSKGTSLAHRLKKIGEQRDAGHEQSQLRTDGGHQAKSTTEEAGR